MSDVIVRVKELTKHYAMVKALDNITFEVRRGEVHALCGENGAGKSTFIKLLTGANEPTKGTIEFEGIEYKKLSTRQAMDLGIAVIYQEFSLVPYLTVAENIFYGREVQKYGVRNINLMNQEAERLCREMGIDIDVKTKVCDLGVAYQQIVEILKAVSKNAKFIIMDEPTAPLTISETKIFFNIIQKMREKNVTIIFISHRLEEVFELCDRVTVLCDGKYVVTKNIDEITKKQLISYMVGRELADDYPSPGVKVGEPVLKVSGMSNQYIKDISFTLNKGEILGFGGLVGAGRTELMRAIFGADKINKGVIEINHKQYKPDTPKEALKAGIGLIPEDRKSQGVILGLSIRENISYSVLGRISKAGIIKKKEEHKLTDAYVESLRIKTPSKEQLVKNLSGGNQQKVVLAKMMAIDCDILIFDEPTRGIDVGAKQEIYNLMCELVKRGKSIIMISSEMPELIGMSTRILVMSNGRISGEFSKEEATQEAILEKASGE